MQGWGYTVFGKVTSGMDVIDKMRGVPTGRFGMHADVPNEPVVINSATIITQ
nr:peptidylprolyl isomerase [Psychrobacter sp.]